MSKSDLKYSLIILDKNTEVIQYSSVGHIASITYCINYSLYLLPSCIYYSICLYLLLIVSYCVSYLIPSHPIYLITIFYLASLVQIGRHDTFANELTLFENQVDKLWKGKNINESITMNRNCTLNTVR